MKVTPPRTSTSTTAVRPRVAASNAAWSDGVCGKGREEEERAEITSRV